MMKKRTARKVIVAITLSLLFGFAPVTRLPAQEASNKLNKQVQLHTDAVELVEVTPSAAQCGKQKGTSIRLRVNSESSVDVRLYIHVGYKRWINRDFASQKRGDEITDFICIEKANYEVFARSAGSSQDWPQP